MGTKDPKHQVFVSSTYEDLIEERKIIIDQLLRLNCIPIGMEFFQPINKQSINIISKILENCDYLVLLVAGRYGSLIKGHSKPISFTEKEYELAIDQEIPVIPILLNKKKLENLFGSKKNKNKTEKTVVGKERLLRFRRRLEEEAVVSFFNSQNELRGLVSTAITDAKKNWERPGWIRVDQKSGWQDILLENTRSRIQQKDYSEIRSHFKKAKRFQLKLAYPLTQKMLGVDEPSINQIQQEIPESVKKKALQSGFYRQNNQTKLIYLSPEWDDYALIYAMCHVAENRLHTENRKFSDYRFFNDVYWWEEPWGNVALYTSIICSEKGFLFTIKHLLSDSQRVDEKYRIECLNLIYRMIMNRDVVNVDLLRRLFDQVSSLPI